MTIKAKKSKINLREKLAELLNFRQIRDRLDGLGLYLGKDRTGTTENVAVRGGASIDDLQLAEISAALGGTAVDVFVYDTRNDSDGGKWRERTQHTSWYNEELNTATRGGRREFPAVAVIVAESDKVTIYDGDDPDMSMWMVFLSSGENFAYGNLSSLSMVNSKLAITTKDSPSGNWMRGLKTIDFISEIGFSYDSPTNTSTDPNQVNKKGYYRGFVIDRNSGSGFDATIIDIVNHRVNDVAMTVLPNAPIDSDTGLPVPTIAVATDGGVSVIKDDGSVISNSDSSYLYVNDVYIDNNYIYASSGKQGSHSPFLRMLNYKGTNLTEYHRYSSSRGGIDYPLLANGSLNGFPDGWIIDGIGKNKAFGGQATNVDSDSIIGLTLLEEEISNPSLGMVAYTTSTYNTGWMPGDIKLATLSDTKIEKVGVDESTELLVDGSNNWIGDFDVAADVSEWTATSDVTVERDTNIYTNGAIKIRQTANSGKGVYKAITTEIGKKYIVSADGVGDNASSSNAVLEIGTTAMGAELGGSIIGSGSTAGSISIVFEATSTTTYISLGPTGSDNRIAYFDNVSVKQTGELITNGTFDNGTTGWNDVSGGVGSYDNGALKITKNINDSLGGVEQAVSGLIEGKQYIFTADIIAVDQATGRIGVGSVSNNTGIANIENLGIGSHSVNFVANQSTMYFVLYASGDFATGGQSVTYDNISVRLAEPDRSVNDNGLQIFGEITKSPVAPGADLVAYSGFSANNYLMQPYNSDLQFGTGDFCVMGWFKNANVNALLCTRLLPQLYNTSGTDRGFLISFGSNGVLSFATYTEGFQATGRKSVGSQNDMSGIDGWTHFVAVRDGGVMKLYINAIKEISETANSDDISDDTTSIPLSIGCFNELSANRFTGSTALIRISATVPTAEQIAKIYRDEKVLFQDGAQATLYGTSDAVTALAYDDKTELLHVGTSSGRSDFAGLRRINNTTTAVTTSISASNNLIAEQ